MQNVACNDLQCCNCCNDATMFTLAGPRGPMHRPLQNPMQQPAATSCSESQEPAEGQSRCGVALVAAETCDDMRDGQIRPMISVTVSPTLARTSVGVVMRHPLPAFLRLQSRSAWPAGYSGIAAPGGCRVPEVCRLSFLVGQSLGREPQRLSQAPDSSARINVPATRRIQATKA